MMLLRTCTQDFHRYVFRSLLLVTAVCGLVGCGGGAGAKLGKVTGKVTLGGQPLGDAVVTFSPKDGSPSAARTAADGTYTLVYSKGVNGAVVGEHQVTISTFQPALEDPPTPAVAEKVPFKYREAEELPKVTVKSGANTFNFDLEAGPLEPPSAKTRTKSKAGDIRCY